MKKIGKIFVPILSGLATIGVVAPLITACSKNAKKYEVNIVNATGVTGEVIQNEFGKNITIKYRLERGYDINKDQVKYIVGTGAAKDPIINETSKEIIINYDSK
ncbi:MAG: hypothetical protein MJ219_03815 [Mycoplasmoidaceae bacterium]|nr:hypothetical protein [Mycoplasmoidaceae bacterium]